MKLKLFDTIRHAFHVVSDMIFIDLDEVFLFLEKEARYG